MTMLQIGFGVADITPPVGANMPGFFHPRPNKGAREPLRATACVLHDGSSTLALVGCDILWVNRDLVHQARERIEKSTRIPPDRVLINASQ